jgi:hypothetical protein
LEIRETISQSSAFLAVGSFREQWPDACAIFREGSNPPAPYQLIAGIWGLGWSAVRGDHEEWQMIDDTARNPGKSGF